MPVEPRNSQGLPLFAQTLEAQRLRQQPPPHEKFFIPQIVLLGLPVLAIGGLLIVARPNIAQTAKTKAAKPAVEKTIVLAQNNGGDIALEPGDESGRRPLDFYTGGVRGNMFSPPEAPKPFVRKVVVAKPAPPKKVELPVVPPPPPVNPFQDWSYTGVITMGETRMALLENTKTKEGQYVKQGESFLGATVGAITDQSITLTSGTTPQTLAKSDAIIVTPLNSNAPFLNGGQPGQPQPGQMPPSGMPQGMPLNVTPMMMPGGGMSQEQRQQMRAQFMNNNFRGGGRGGRGGR